MKLRIARKIINSVRKEGYTERQLANALRRYNKSQESKQAEAYWCNLMEFLGPVGRAQVVASWSPADAFNLLMRTPEEKWEGDNTKVERLS